MSKKNRGILLLAAAAVLFLGLSGGYYYAEGQRYMETVASYSADRSLTLVIDPGHGGADGGAVSLTGAYESDINLAIALRLEAIAALYGIPAELTRDTADLDYPEDADTIREKKVADTGARVEQIEQTDHAVLLSIHQNIYDGPGVSGPQVLYADTTASAEFAQVMQDTLTAALQPEKVRAPTGVSDDVYIMNHIDCPGILVECGFLSNPGEEELLRTEAYQLKLAAAMAAGYIGAAEQLESRYFG